MLLNLSPNDIGEWTKDEQEDLLDILKAKQKSVYNYNVTLLESDK